MADLIVRNGTIVDGTGAAPLVGDVAITGRAHHRGRRRRPAAARARSTPTACSSRPASSTSTRTSTARSPGIRSSRRRRSARRHDDRDGQLRRRASRRRTTTATTGSSALLEGVEDIPGTALAEGLTWDWETFPEYLDALETKPHTVDMGVHVPHAALRTYVMGERGADHTEAPTDDELDTARAPRRAKGSRRARSASRPRAPTCTARRTARTSARSPRAERELLAIADAMQRGGHGRDPADLRLLPDARRRVRRHASSDLIEAFVRTSGRPLSFTVQQAYHSPDRWRHLFARVGGPAGGRLRREAAGGVASDRRAARPRGDREPVPVHAVVPRARGPPTGRAGRRAARSRTAPPDPRRARAR